MAKTKVPHDKRLASRYYRPAYVGLAYSIDAKRRVFSKAVGGHIAGPCALRFGMYTIKLYTPVEIRCLFGALTPIKSRRVPDEVKRIHRRYWGLPQERLPKSSPDTESEPVSCW